MNNETKSFQFLNESDIKILKQRTEKEFIWETFNMSQTLSFDINLTKNIWSNTAPYSRKFQFVKIIGEPGNYGSAILVIDQSNNYPYVIKLSFADESFLDEVNTLDYILRKSINMNLSPNFTVLDSYFVSHLLPPSSGTWRKLYEELQDNLIFKKMVQLHGKGKKLSNLASSLNITQFSSENPIGFGYIVMEYGGEGTLSNLKDMHISKIEQRLYNKENEKIKTIQSFMKNIIFQLLYALLSMNIMKLQHRDLASSNIVLIDERKRELMNKKFKRPLIYTIKNIDFVINESEYYLPLTLLIIDYSLTLRVGRGYDDHIDYPKVKLFYRPPELLFIKRDAKFVVYRAKSDMFSAAISILHSIMGDDYIPTSDVPQKLIDSISEGCMIGEWSKNKRNILSEFICNNLPALYLAAYIWKLFKLIGPPSPELWPDVVESDLYQRALPTIEEYKNEFANGPLISQPDGIVMRYLGKDGVNLIQKMLQWNPSNRPDVAEILITDSYFSSIREESNVPSSLFKKTELGFNLLNQIK